MAQCILLLVPLAMLGQMEKYRAAPPVPGRLLLAARLKAVVLSRTNYVIAAGLSTVGSTRTVTCATGYTGTATSISCQSSLAWSSLSGCSLVSCGSPVASSGYTLGSGSTRYNSVYTMTCATSYSGTAASIVCQPGGSCSTQSVQ
jgi:hypothetical protein